MVVSLGIAREGRGVDHGVPQRRQQPRDGDRPHEVADHREEWEKIDREVRPGGLGENLEFRTGFTHGDKGEEVLTSLEVVEGNLEPYTAYDLVEQMGRLRELLISHGVESFSLSVTRTGDADASELDVERVRITPEGVFTQHAEITFSAWGRVEP